MTYLFILNEFPISYDFNKATILFELSNMKSRLENLKVTALSFVLTGDGYIGNMFMKRVLLNGAKKCINCF